MSDLTTDIFAKTIFGEARGETLAGQEAVASVILNRVKKSQQKGHCWWGNTIVEKVKCCVFPVNTDVRCTTYNN